MRKAILLMILVFGLSLSAMSQAMIGFNMSEVRDNFPDAKWSYGIWEEENRLQSMTFEDDNMAVIFYFNSSYVCFITAIVPKTQGFLQGMIEKYNSRYVVVNDTSWKFYTNGGVLKCTLEHTDKGVYFFKWFN